MSLFSIARISLCWLSMTACRASILLSLSSIISRVAGFLAEPLRVSVISWLSGILLLSALACSFIRSSGSILNGYGVILFSSSMASNHKGRDAKNN